jgi:hypothetical protein
MPVFFKVFFHANVTIAEPFADQQFILTFSARKCGLVLAKKWGDLPPQRGRRPAYPIKCYSSGFSGLRGSAGPSRG